MADDRVKLSIHGTNNALAIDSTILVGNIEDLSCELDKFVELNYYEWNTVRRDFPTCNLTSVHEYSCNNNKTVNITVTEECNGRACKNL